MTVARTTLAASLARVVRSARGPGRGAVSGSVHYRVAAETTRSFPDGVVLQWRGPLADEEMVDLVASHGGKPVPGWWDRIRPHSLGWVSARIGDGTVIGFANVVSDGGDHAFLIDPKTRRAFQRRQVATRVVRFAAHRAKAAGCEWLHVDFDDDLKAFYFGACGFAPTNAGLINLHSLPEEAELAD